MDDRISAMDTKLDKILLLLHTDRPSVQVFMHLCLFCDLKLLLLSVCSYEFHFYYY